MGLKFSWIFYALLIHKNNIVEFWLLYNHIRNNYIMGLSFLLLPIPDLITSCVLLIVCVMHLRRDLGRDSSRDRRHEELAVENSLTVQARDG